MLFDSNSSDQYTSALRNNQLHDNVSSRSWEGAKPVAYITSIALLYSSKYK